jgi:hypothetical protein
LKARFLVARTHGGLGNQLFQILYARLLAEKQGSELRETHDLRYPHAFARSQEIQTAGNPDFWQGRVSALRVPKILGRALGRAEMPWQWMRTVYVDGYFQQADHYACFDSSRIAHHIRRLSGELDIRPAEEDRHLVHIRLGDFFSGKESASQHAKERIAVMPEGCFIMSNDEALLRTPAIGQELKRKNIIIVSTEGAAAEEVIRRMARFSHIDANDSTLSFWASILGGGSLQLSNAVLQQSHTFFKSVTSS